MELSHREKALVAVPVLLAGLFSFYNWVHEPLFARKHAASSLLTQAQADLKRDSAKVRAEGDLKARASAVSNREQMVDAWVPGKNSATMLIWYLSQAESRSGARIGGIKVSAVKVVSVVEAQGLKSQPAAAPAAAAAQPGAPVAPPATPAQAPAPAPVPAAAKAQDGEHTVAVVGMDLKVDAHFVEHLLFDQALEQMPLFLSVDSFSLERTDKGQSSIADLAAKKEWDKVFQTLQASPVVTASYHLNLYFKGQRPGPAVSNGMPLDTGTARPDPFTLDSVGEMVQVLQDAFTPAPGAGGQDQNSTAPVKQPEQLG